MTHLTFEQISDLADSRAESREPRAESHLAECSECRETLRRVRDLVVAAHALPRDIAPPPEVWTALRARVANGPARRSKSRWWYGGGIAAAAAIILMVGAAVLVPRGTGKAKASKLASSAPPPASPVMLLAVDNSYTRTLAELRLALDAQRTTLSPATVRVLERSLAAIDAAIAEAREALANDPANQILVGILSANYERKVELLQRATELSSSS